MTMGPMTSGPGGDELRIRRFLLDLGLGIRSGEPEAAHRAAPPPEPTDPRRPDPLAPALLVLLVLAGLVTALLYRGAR